MNLSSVYMISILLTSIAGVGSAFLGNKFVPMVSQPTEVSSVVEPPKEEPAPPEVPSKVAYEQPPPTVPSNAVPSVPGESN